MTRVLQIVLIALLVLPSFAQSSDSKFEKELSQAKDAFNSNRY